MAQIKGLLLNGKPLVKVALADAVPEPQALSPLANSEAFHVHHYTALVDTGADISCLTDRVVNECGLKSLSFINMTSGNGENLHLSYLIHLGIWCEEQLDFEGEEEVQRTLFQLPAPILVAAIRNNKWFDIIIGTDILAEHNFTLAKGGQFTLTLG